MRLSIHPNWFFFKLCLNALFLEYMLLVVMQGIVQQYTLLKCLQSTAFYFYTKNYIKCALYNILWDLYCLGSHGHFEFIIVTLLLFRYKGKQIY